MKRCWNKEYAYGRLLDILEDYWITQPEEKRVRIDMHFEHMDGRTQDKTITWRNPRCPSEKMQLIPMSEVLTLDSVIEKLAMAYIFNTDDKTHLTPVNDEVIFHATEALKRAKNKYEARVLSPEELRDLAELPSQTPALVWKEWHTGDGAWMRRCGMDGGSAWVPMVSCAARYAVFR